MAAGGDLERIFAALSRAGTRYLVVGGVAVVLHGHPRFTADLDLVLALDPGNARAAIGALRGLGYRPRAPVSLDDFSDARTRERWIEEKRLTVLSLWSEELPLTDVDLFVAEPFPFAPAFSRALRANLGSVTVSVASLEDLIALKRAAARPKDLEDVRALEEIARARGENELG
jgi:hypothetical protein